MRVAILGASGMLGHAACQALGGLHEAHAICRSLDGIPVARRTCFESCHMHEGFDALDPGALEAYLGRVQPDVVINCVGAVKQLPQGQDPLQAIPINSTLPHRLAQQCDASGAKLIQISTDCVFSGRKGRYVETDTPDAEDLYGRSKLLGEVMCAPHLTLRTSIIGPQLRGRTGLLEWLHSQRGSRVSGFTRSIYSGLTTQALAEVLAQILSDPPTLSGLYHVASEPISKFDLLQLMNERFRWGIAIREDDALVCDRSLDSTAFQKATSIEVPDQRAMIKKMTFGVEA